MKSFSVKDYNGVPCIDSISLYSVIGLPDTHYSYWAARLHLMGDENVDFFKHKSMVFDTQKFKLRRRYHISIVFACELCAAARTSQGRSLKYELRRLLGTTVKYK